jgi:hypothetical protein
MKLSREKIAYNSYKVPQPKVLDKNALALDRVFREVSILNTVFFLSLVNQRIQYKNRIMSYLSNLYQQMNQMSKLNPTFSLAE